MGRSIFIVGRSSVYGGVATFKKEQDKRLKSENFLGNKTLKNEAKNIVCIYNYL